MPTSQSHGFPYIEPERHDELTPGVPAPAQDGSGSERTALGRWVAGARSSQSLGGKARKGKPRLGEGVALTKAGRSLHRTLCREISSTVGGGVCGVAASLFLRWASDKTELAEKAKLAGDMEAFRKLSESARMDVLYAREHAAKEAMSRPKPNPIDELERRMKAIKLED